MRSSGTGLKCLSRIVQTIVFVGLLLLGSERVAADEPLRVAVTVPPQGWLVEQIGGDAVDVLVVVGAGESPVTFQPTDAQVTALSRASLYFRIGVPVERSPWFRALRSLSELRIVDLREGLELRKMPSHRHGHGGHHHHGEEGSKDYDPHVWISPKRLIAMAESITRELIAVDPEQGSSYQLGRDRLVTELESLDAELREQLAPLAGRPFIVFHPAWGYFADDYGLRQVAIEFEGKEPSEIELTRLTREARRLGTRAIFVQPQITGKSARSIATAVGAKVVTIDPLASDVPDNLRQVADLLIANSPSDSR